MKCIVKHSGFKIECITLSWAFCFLRASFSICPPLGRVTRPFVLSFPSCDGNLKWEQASTAVYSSPSGLDRRGLDHSEACPKRMTMVMRCAFTQLGLGIGLQGECSSKEGEEKQSLPKEEPCLPSSSSCLISRDRTDSWLINRYGGSVGKMLKYFHVDC